MLWKISFLPERLISSGEPCQLLLFGPHRLARAALGFDLSRLAPPAIQRLVRDSELLGHRPTRFPCEPDGFGSVAIGIFPFHSF